MQQALEDLQRVQSNSTQQLSKVKDSLQSLRQDLESRLKIEMQSMRREIKTALQAAKEAAAKDSDALRKQVDELAAKHSAQDALVTDTQKALQRQLGDLREEISAGSTSMAELKERLNFHENLIMDEQHGSRNAAVTVSTSERLNSLSEQMRGLERGLKKSFLEELNKVARSQKAPPSEADVKGELCLQCESMHKGQCSLKMCMSMSGKDCLYSRAGTLLAYPLAGTLNIRLPGWIYLNLASSQAEAGSSAPKTAFGTSLSPAYKMCIA